MAEAKVAVAKEKVSDDINIRYAKASADSGRGRLRVNKEANDKVKGAVPDMVLRGLRMKYDEASLGIEKAKLELRIAGEECDAAQAEVDAAEENVRRHQIRSPQTGVIVKLHRHLGRVGAARRAGGARHPHRPALGRRLRLRRRLPARRPPQAARPR